MKVEASLRYCLPGRLHIRQELVAVIGRYVHSEELAATTSFFTSDTDIPSLLLLHHFTYLSAVCSTPAASLRSFIIIEP